MTFNTGNDFVVGDCSQPTTLRGMLNARLDSFPARVSFCRCRAIRDPSVFWHTEKEAGHLMIAFNAHFDGKVIVPEHPVNLPLDRAFVVHVETSGHTDSEPNGEPVSGLRWLAENAVEDELPSDLAAQHDHYLYGTAKRR